jgi:hypothetical protein
MINGMARQNLPKEDHAGRLHDQKVETKGKTPEVEILLTILFSPVS